MSKAIPQVFMPMEHWPKVVCVSLRDRGADIGREGPLPVNKASIEHETLSFGDREVNQHSGASPTAALPTPHRVGGSVPPAALRSVHGWGKERLRHYS